jgi:hypothetical protein
VKGPSAAADEGKEIDAIVIVLCVRRQLTDSGSLKLTPYTYRIHLDVHRSVELPTPESDVKER